MEAAQEYVRLHKTPYKTVAKKFQVPRITLKYKVERKRPFERCVKRVQPFQQCNSVADSGSGMKG